MPNARAQYEPLAWWYTRRLTGRSLRQRYQASKELPPSLLALVRKLDEVEVRLEASGQDDARER
jgi:hypothetical protein